MNFSADVPQNGTYKMSRLIKYPQMNLLLCCFQI